MAALGAPDFSSPVAAALQLQGRRSGEGGRLRSSPPVVANQGRHVSLFRRVRAFASRAAPGSSSLTEARDLSSRILSAVEAESL
eukprot:8168203-Pyramimonas_sp.AAC.1